MEWRFATADDARVLTELNHQLIADEGHRNPMDVPQLEQRMRAWLSGEYRAVLFERDGAVAGYALYRLDGPDRVHLRQFFVARAWRRRGVGREAMQRLLAEVLPHAARVVVEVLTPNAAGRAFWDALGFREYAVVLEREPIAASDPTQTRTS